MDADNNPQVESEPLIEVNLGENGGKVTFASIEEARDWAEQERSQWQNFWNRIRVGGHTPDVLNRQIELPTKIRDALNDAEQLPDSDQPKALREIEKLFERYADYASLCSKSPLGKTILHGDRRRHVFLKVGALASVLGIPAEDVLDFEQIDDQQSAMILSGYAIGGMRNVVKRSDIAHLQSRVDEQRAKMASIVERAETDLRAIAEHGKKTTDELDRLHEAQQSQWNKFHTAADKEWQSLRRVYEEHLRLEAPATYWKGRASQTSQAAMAWLTVFATLAGAFIWGIMEGGPKFVETVAEHKNIGDFATLTLVSIPALTALWILRHIGRLFVTNFERSGDATMRQTMATTFLALTKEGSEKITSEERLMVLEALFRAPAPSRGDDGHLGAVLEAVTRRKPKD